MNQNSAIKEQTSEPLVSVIVITYNSAKFITETLESIKSQTYQNLELIVSDDCSSDNTIDICNKWVESNKSRFIHSAIITSDKNTGIPANCNRGLRASKGQLIKSIAGDDTMEIDFISRCVPEFNDPNCAVCYTNSNLINSKSEFIRKDDCNNFKSGNIFDDIFFLRFCPRGPSYMYRREALFEVGLYNEDIWVEDYLMLLKLTYLYEVKHINEYLVNYRRHESNSGKTSFKLLDSQLQSIMFFKHYSGYKQRKQEIELNKLFHAAKYQKISAINEFFKCFKHIHNLLYAKSLIYWILFWPALKKKEY